jgi:hypothetical protein
MTSQSQARGNIEAPYSRVEQSEITLYQSSGQRTQDGVDSKNRSPDAASSDGCRIRGHILLGSDRHRKVPFSNSDTVIALGKMRRSSDSCCCVELRCSPCRGRLLVECLSKGGNHNWKLEQVVQRQNPLVVKLSSVSVNFASECC